MQNFRRDGDLLQANEKTYRVAGHTYTLIRDDETTRQRAGLYFNGKPALAKWSQGELCVPSLAQRFLGFCRRLALGE